MFFIEKKSLVEFTSSGLNSYILVLRDCYFALYVSYSVPLIVFYFVGKIVNRCVIVSVIDASDPDRRSSTMQHVHSVGWLQGYVK